MVKFPSFRFGPSAALLVVLPLASSAAVLAQEHDHPSAEEFVANAEAAEASPLFGSDEVLKFTLRTDIEWLRDERSDEEEVEGSVILTGEDGSEVALPVQVRTRGNFRRDKRNCNFPPLRLNFPTSEVEGSVFEGQDKLKLVAPCHDGRDSYQEYVFYEYLVYRTFNLVTPVSLRVRLVEVTFEDIEDDYDTRTKYGFLIEDEAQMAARNRSVLEEVGSLNPGLTSGEFGTMMALFQLLIGNTDWSSMHFHNMVLVHTEEGRYLTVPYDFDFSGAVDARYATPDPILPIRNVRERIFRGLCFPHVRDYAQWSQYFNDRRQAITDLYMGFDLLDEGDREDAVEYFDEFWEIMDDERKYQREVVEQCRG